MIAHPLLLSCSYAAKEGDSKTKKVQMKTETAKAQVNTSPLRDKTSDKALGLAESKLLLHSLKQNSSPCLKITKKLDSTVEDNISIHKTKDSQTSS
jgi:hypothetical protein